MGAKLTIDPAGSPTSQTLTAALWRDAPEHARTIPRQTFRGPGAGIRTNAPVTTPAHTGTLTIRVTGAERATFRTAILPGLLDGETLRVYPDSGGAAYVDGVLDSLEWMETYTRLFRGLDEWFTLQVPFAHAAGDAL